MSKNSGLTVSVKSNDGTLGSGKTTLANAIALSLKKAGFNVEIEGGHEPYEPATTPDNRLVSIVEDFGV